jgi:hypothetical protein
VALRLKKFGNPSLKISVNMTHKHLTGVTTEHVPLGGGMSASTILTWLLFRVLEPSSVRTIAFIQLTHQQPVPEVTNVTLPTTPFSLKHSDQSTVRSPTTPRLEGGEP